ncbi:DNA-DIRECTED RNA polymerase SUBUNIT BETA [Salix viminalis]|uniref:DNA-directed RNA polymerase n=1 Tax=Salix viminalis TaxID=40686 RepID=A0A9Q0V6Z8_SALVM|nr:DNA-DIRECTED RNA polymerase SUBUNIT BETA [Salix viminalis]
MVSFFQVDGKGLRSCGKSWVCKSTANNDRSVENKAAGSVHGKESLIDELFDSEMEKLVDDTYTKLDGKHKVFLNGEWVGVCKDSCLFVGKLRSMRRRRQLPYQVEIKRDEQQREVHTFSDAGRILRPRIVVEKLDKIKAFREGNYIFASLLDKGIIEFIGTEEEKDCCTAWGIKFSFRGYCGKQSMNAAKARVVLVKLQGGVDNKELTDKRRKSEDSITFGKIQSKIGRVDSLDNDGFPFIGANIQSGDIVIGKCAESGTDHSVKLKHTEKGHGPESGIVI